MSNFVINPYTDVAAGDGDPVWGKDHDQVIEDFTTYANTTEGDASWPTSDVTKYRVNPSTNVLDVFYDADDDSENWRTYYDVGTANISETEWVLRFKFDMTAFTPNTLAANDTIFFILLGAGTGVGYNQTTDGLGLRFRNVGTTNDFEGYANNGGSFIVSDTTITPSARTYYCQFTRTSATNFRTEIFSDDKYKTQLGSTTNQTITTAYSGLRYFYSSIFTQANNGNMTATIDDIEIQTGVNAWV